MNVAKVGKERVISEMLISELVNYCCIVILGNVIVGVP